LEVSSYLGLEISKEAVALARTRTTKTFLLIRPTEVWAAPRDLHLSVDVLQHQTNERQYRNHMTVLCSARRYAIVAAPNAEPHDNHAPHVLYRPWQADMPSGWTLVADDGDMTFWGRNI
jgi:hypothetical protein